MIEALVVLITAVMLGNYFIIKTLEEIRDELRKLNGKVER